MKQFFAIIFLLVLASCNKDPYSETLFVMDDELTGAWWDTNTIYYFKDNGDGDNDTLYYGEKHIRSGVGTDSIVTDSVFGWFQLDLERQNITFNVQGWVTKYDSITVYKNLNSTTWNYSIEDTVLTYESSTALGQLTRYK